MKILFLQLTLISLSCVSAPDKAVMYSNAIHSKGYVKGVYDCSNMSYDLARKLEAEGYDARIICYGRHCIVEVNVNGSCFYYDPTKRNPVVQKPKAYIKSTWTVRQIDLLLKNESIKKDFKGHLKEK